MSARTFSRTIGVPENNTQNYLGPRAMLPKADYLEKVVLHFQSINPDWLLTGRGEAILPETTSERAGAVSQNRKISRSIMVGGNVAGSATQNHGISANEQALQRELELLRSQLADKERTIQILLDKR